MIRLGQWLFSLWMVVGTISAIVMWLAFLFSRPSRDFESRPKRPLVRPIFLWALAPFVVLFIITAVVAMLKGL
jgi:hypothetical protein